MLIDTNIYSLSKRGDPRIVSILQKSPQIGISTISLAELYSGFKGGSREDANKWELKEFLDSPRVRIFPIDEKTAEYYGVVLSELRRIGKPIPTNNIWIAACAMSSGIGLLTRDEHFRFVPGLLLL